MSTRFVTAPATRTCLHARSGGQANRDARHRACKTPRRIRGRTSPKEQEAAGERRARGRISRLIGATQTAQFVSFEPRERGAAAERDTASTNRVDDDRQGMAGTHEDAQRILQTIRGEPSERRARCEGVHPRQARPAPPCTRCVPPSSGRNPACRQRCPPSHAPVRHQRRPVEAPRSMIGLTPPRCACGHPRPPRAPPRVLEPSRHRAGAKPRSAAPAGPISRCRSKGFQ